MRSELLRGRAPLPTPPALVFTSPGHVGMCVGQPQSKALDEWKAVLGQGDRSILSQQPAAETIRLRCLPSGSCDSCAACGGSLIHVNPSLWAAPKRRHSVQAGDTVPAVRQQGAPRPPAPESGWGAPRAGLPGSSWVPEPSLHSFPTWVTPEVQSAWQLDGLGSDWLGLNILRAPKDSPGGHPAFCDSAAEEHPCSPPFSSCPSETAQSFLRPAPWGLTLKFSTACLALCSGLYILCLKSQQSCKVGISPHFTGGETEAETGHVTCQGPHHWQVVESRFAPRPVVPASLYCLVPRFRIRPWSGRRGRLGFEGRGQSFAQV